MTEIADLRPNQKIVLKYMRGNGVTITYTAEENGSPIDVSDRTYSAAIKKTHRSTTSYEFDVDDTDAATGVIVFTLSEANSIASPERGIWSAEYRVGDGAPQTVMYGDTQVTGDAL